MPATATSDHSQAGHVLAVQSPCARNLDWTEQVRRCLPDQRVDGADSFLGAIADLCRRPARAVLVRLDPGYAQMAAAIGGLRQAAGAQARLLLCCTPDVEPLARGLVDEGADDYVLCPLDSMEVARAVGCACPVPASTPHPPAVSLEELATIGELVSAMGDDPVALLGRCAGLVRRAMNAQGASVVSQGTAATSGQMVTKPVLTAPMTEGTVVVGQLAVLERSDRPYDVGDARKLQQYAEFIQRILAEASGRRTLRRLADTDECSGLHNRRYLRQRLAEILQRARRERFPVTVLALDLDDFKTYNDRFGHPAGDEIIRTTGELLSKHCREQDVVARMGGDEFAVVFWDAEGPRMPGSKHPEGALSVMERVKVALQSQSFPLLGPAGRGQLTISGGLATFPWDGDDPQTLLDRADEALLAAKCAGKNRIQLIGQAP